MKGLEPSLLEKLFDDNPRSAGAGSMFKSISLEQAVGRHERRLKNVSVQLDAGKQFAGGLHFTIHALLDLEPAREPVSFDAMLQPSTLQYQVTRARRTQQAL